MVATTNNKKRRIPSHIALIMDGIHRWAQQQGVPRRAAYEAATHNVPALVATCLDQGIHYMTLYAFSSYHWDSSSLDANDLFVALGHFLTQELTSLQTMGVSIHCIGQLQHINDSLTTTLMDALEQTRHNNRLTLTIAINYGGRTDIVAAVRALAAKGMNPETIDERVISAHLSTDGLPDPDLVIHTSGERRLSNFLIWETAYSEYWTTPAFWPDFGAEQLLEALSDYERRERRFGGVTS